MLISRFTTEGRRVRGLLCDACQHPHLLVPGETSWSILRKQNSSNLFEEVQPSLSPEGLQDWFAENQVQLGEQTALWILSETVTMHGNIAFADAGKFLASGRPPVRHLAGRVLRT